jgi:hypothetical protein
MGISERTSEGVPGALVLPADLVQRGFRLIVCAPDRMYAVSSAWGGTEVLGSLALVVFSARELVRYFEWRERRNAEAGNDRTR